MYGGAKFTNLYTIHSLKEERAWERQNPNQAIDRFEVPREAWKRLIVKRDEHRSELRKAHRNLNDIANIVIMPSGTKFNYIYTQV